MSLEALIQRNQQFLADLFNGPFRGHALVMDPEPIAPPGPGDVTCSDRPLSAWIDWALQDYEAQCQRLEALQDDSVPEVRVHTGTQIFAAAFGCTVHVYPDSPPCARPRVTTAEEAERLPEPPLDAPPLDKIWEFAERLRERVGPGVPLRVPDIQSPFDIAALIWRKEDFFLALYQHPQAAKRLIEKCHRFLKAFLQGYQRRFSPCNFIHCPRAWAPPELGCAVSEDEAGSISVRMFEEFSLPSLIDLSQSFGGLFVHCCAAADHQYQSFRKIPRLRGLNRVFQVPPGPRPAIETFSDHTVFLVAWTDEGGVRELLDLARPETRFLFNMGGQPLEEARQTYERLRAWCPRN